MTQTTAADSVVIVAAARFIVKAEFVPQAVRPRDIHAYLEGMVEEHAPLPIDHISWGCLSDKSAGKSRRALIYAAAREQVFGPSRRAVPQRPTYPSFVALYGLKVKKPTWVFLVDSHCLSAVLMLPGQNTPERVHSRYLETLDEGGRWSARTRLIEQAAPDNDHVLLPGIARIAGAVYHNSTYRVQFNLERRQNLGGQWEPWQQTRLAPEAISQNADLRDHAQIVAEKSERRAGKTLRLAALGITVALLAIISLEALLHSRAAVADELVEQARKQKDAVAQLQQMETMTKALEGVLSRQNRPFDLLAALNRKRPESIYFKTMSVEDSDRMSIGGEADNAQAVNSYITALKEQGYWKTIDLTDVQTQASGGTTFRLSLKADAVKLAQALRSQDAAAQTAATADAQAGTATSGAQAGAVAKAPKVAAKNPDAANGLAHNQKTAKAKKARQKKKHKANAKNGARAKQARPKDQLAANTSGS